MHIDNKGKDIIILGEGSTQRVDDTTLTAEAKYPINFTQSGKRFELSLHYNGNNRFLFVEATKTYQFNAKDSEIKDYALCLGNFSKIFKLMIWKKTQLNNGVVIFFSVDFIPIDANNILDIHKYLMKRTKYKIIFGLFIGLLTGIVSASNHAKCVSLRNQKSNFSY